MNDRLFAVLSKLRRVASAIVPPKKLPPELLRTIFSYLRPGYRHGWIEGSSLPYANLLAASHVCRIWREVAVSATELWTDIILGAGYASVGAEIAMTLLCVHRSGVRPLDFIYTSLSSIDPPDVADAVPDRCRLRSVVSWYGGDSSVEDLANFLMPASRLEYLEIDGDGESPLPTLFSGPPRCLRELVLLKCTPWPNNQFGSLTLLNLLGQDRIEVDISSLLGTLRCSPHLEELLLENRFHPGAESEYPEHRTTAIPLHSLKRLYICRLPPGATRHLLGALDLLPNGISMRFSNIPTEFGGTFPETIMPELSPRTATKLEIIYPSTTGMILHATNGVAHTRWAHRYYQGHQLFEWIAEKRHEAYPLKELWLHVYREQYFWVPPPHALPDLETLVIETNISEKFYDELFLMLSPDEDGVPYPLISTLEVRNLFWVTKFGEVLKARSDAGFRLKTLRIRWFDDCEARMASLAQFVDKLEFYHVSDEASRGMELPPECMTRSPGRGRWDPWLRQFVGTPWGNLGD